ncbi:MAG: Nif3-like dinuclear metal center hexameric protein [Clostridia bacterium]|nr:Nif3-like dinuclear metal center hexameric protein [Clostridia bacterium]
MKLSEIYEIADELAPKRLSDEYCSRYGAYDNSGVLVDTGNEIAGVLFSLDLSFAAIDQAVEAGANLIVTHHPAIYGKIGNVRISDFQPLGEKLVKCMKNGISVLSMHLNLDGAEGGIDESLQEGVCLACGMESKGAGTRSKLMHPLENGGYGRAYEVAETALGTLAENLKKEFKTDRVLVYGDKNGKIRKAASFCGAGADENAIAFACEAGAEVVISSDFKHHVLTLAAEKGIAVIALTHYASENYGFEKYYEKIRRRLDIPCGYHTDAELL